MGIDYYLSVYTPFDIPYDRTIHNDKSIQYNQLSEILRNNREKKNYLTRCWKIWNES